MRQECAAGDGSTVVMCCGRGVQVVQGQQEGRRVGQVYALDNVLGGHLDAGLGVVHRPRRRAKTRGGCECAACKWRRARAMHTVANGPAHAHLGAEDLLARNPPVRIHQVEPVRQYVHCKRSVPPRHQQLVKALRCFQPRAVADARRASRCCQRKWRRTPRRPFLILGRRPCAISPRPTGNRAERMSGTVRQ